MPISPRRRNPYPRPPPAGQRQHNDENRRR